MGEACRTHEKCVKEMWFEIPRGRDHSEDLGLDGRVIFK